MSAVLEEFIQTARQYTELIEHLPETPVDELLGRSLLLLPRILACGLELTYEKDGEPTDLPESALDRQLLYEDLKAKLGNDINLYRSVFHPYQDTQADINELADDLVDIYMDLKPGIGAFENGDAHARAYARSSWYFGFGAAGCWHTGHHIASAIRALYAWHAMP